MNIADRRGFTFIELLLVILVIAVLSAIALPNILRAKERALYAEFQANAHQIGVALECFAINHEGRYPQDGVLFNPPPGGFTPGHINWNASWRIDYEVHNNGSGGQYVGLEYFYPGQGYRALCNSPVNRALYLHGGPIPGERNRIWIFHENASIMP